MEPSLIPNRKANLVIINSKTSDEIRKNLKKYFKYIVYTCPNSDINTYLSYHVDMSIHPVEKNTLVVAPNVYTYYKKLESYGIKVIEGINRLMDKYPYDISYNCLDIGEYYLHNSNYTDKNIYEYYLKKGVKCIHIKQGYSKCSVLIVDANHFITSDKNIANQLNKIGKKVLLINQGFIELRGMNYGLIGGCGGNYSPNEILLTGSLSNHPDCQRIIKFITDAKVNIHYLSQNPISDIGSIYCFKVHE